MTRLMEWLNADATPDFIAATVVMIPILAAIIVIVASMTLIQN